MKLYDIEEPSIEIEAKAAPFIVGIDFGTTNSLIAHSEDFKVNIVPIDGAYKMPSIVRINDDNHIRSIKRHIARREKTVNIAKHKYNTIALASTIFSHLKQQAEKHFGRIIDQAVVTVPAYFDEQARAAVKEAAQAADITVRRLLNEPTAAAIAYGLDQGVKGYVLVFDMGGGTFDVSIMKMQMGVFRVIATNGDNFLGGNDFDHILETLLTEQGEKVSLSEAQRRKEDININPTGPLYDEFVARSMSLAQRAIKLSLQAILQADLTLNDIEHVILVGGSTRLHFIQDIVRKTFTSQQIHDYIDPDLSVVMGAAFQAEFLTGHRRAQGDFNLLLDVTPLSLGIELLDGGVENIIERNSPLPCVATKIFTNGKKGQESFDIHILQGERTKAKDNRSITRMVLNNLPAHLEAGEMRLHITFTLDVDGILTVTAREDTIGTKLETQVNPSFGLSYDAAKTLVYS